jgi:hypothetical protein
MQQRHYRLRRSRSLALLLSLLCVAVLAVLTQLPLSTAALLPAAAAILYWTGHCLLFDAYLRMGNSCAAFRLEGGDEIVLLLRSGSHVPGRISPDSLVTPYLVILNVILGEQRSRVRSVLILADAMEADSFRRLRVALRWSGRSDQVAV